jgi:hypothetical protein
VKFIELADVGCVVVDDDDVVCDDDDDDDDLMRDAGSESFDNFSEMDWIISPTLMK